MAILKLEAVQHQHLVDGAMPLPDELGAGLWQRLLAEIDVAGVYELFREAFQLAPVAGARPQRTRSCQAMALLARSRPGGMS